MLRRRVERAISAAWADVYRRLSGLRRQLQRLYSVLVADVVSCNGALMRIYCTTSLLLQMRRLLTSAQSIGGLRGETPSVMRQAPLHSEQNEIEWGPVLPLPSPFFVYCRQLSQHPSFYTYSKICWKSLNPEYQSLPLEVLRRYPKTFLFAR